MFYIGIKAEYNINGFTKKALKATVTVDLSIKGSFTLYQHKTQCT